MKFVYSLLIGLMLATSSYADTRVEDNAGVIDASSKAWLEDVLNHDDTLYFRILTVNSLNGQTPQQLATKKFAEWQMGANGRNGVLILLAIKEHKSRIQLGESLEGRMSSQACTSLLDSVKPEFRAGKFGDGLISVVKVLHGKLSTVQHVDVAPAHPEVPPQIIIQDFNPPKPEKVAPVVVPEEHGNGGYIFLAILGVLSLGLTIHLLLKKFNKPDEPVKPSYTPTLSKYDDYTTGKKNRPKKPSGSGGNKIKTPPVTHTTTIVKETNNDIIPFAAGVAVGNMMNKPAAPSPAPYYTPKPVDPPAPKHEDRSYGGSSKSDDSDSGSSYGGSSSWGSSDDSGSSGGSSDWGGSSDSDGGSSDWGGGDSGGSGGDSGW